MNKTLLRTPTSCRRASWCNDILEKNERLPRERSWLLTYNNYSISPSWIWSDKITIERVARVGYNHFISNKGEWNDCFSKFSNRFCCRFLFPQFYKAHGRIKSRHVVTSDYCLAHFQKWKCSGLFTAELSHEFIIEVRCMELRYDKCL